jgi:phosphonoacetate hydrolase
MKKLLIIVIEGCSLEYISLERTPNLYRIAKNGFCKCVKAAVPTIYNVNHASILTGKFPSEHGVIGNALSYPSQGNEDSNPSDDLSNQNYSFIASRTVFDFMRGRGASTALLSARSEVGELLGRNVDFGICLERPKDILVRFLDMQAPPPAESLEASIWILEACYRLIKKNTMDVIYCTTNDYMMRNFAPESPEAILQMKKIDDWLGKIYDLDHDREIYITGGFGVTEKPRLINLQRKLQGNGFEVECKTPHHDQPGKDGILIQTGMQFLSLNRGGSIANPPKDKSREEELVQFLEAAPFIDLVSPKAEASKRYNLPEDLIGDYVVFAAEGYTFADFDGEELELEEFRSNGSLHERAIPLVAVNADEAPEKYRYSRDVVKTIMERPDGK